MTTTSTATIAQGHLRAKPRLGFLGVGWIGRNRLEAIACEQTADIVCIVDANPQAVEAARSAAPACAIGTTLDELLERELDGIVIATPSALHAEQTIAALERGFAVFCQKPLARTAAETRQVIDAARCADRLLGVDLSYRFVEGARRIRELIERNSLGEIFAADLVFHNAYGPDKAWFFDPKLSGGGCVIDLGIHLVDLALWMMHFPEVSRVSSQLFAKGAALKNPNACVEDFAIATIELATGATVRLTCSWNLHAGCDAVIEARFFGSRGGAELRNINGSFYNFEAHHFRNTHREQLAAPPDAWPGRALAQWARQLATGNSFDPDIERMCAVAETLDAIYGRQP